MTSHRLPIWWFKPKSWTQPIAIWTANAPNIYSVPVKFKRLKKCVPNSLGKEQVQLKVFPRCNACGLNSNVLGHTPNWANTGMLSRSAIKLKDILWTSSRTNMTSIVIVSEKWRFPCTWGSSGSKMFCMSRKIMWMQQNWQHRLVWNKKRKKTK